MFLYDRITGSAMPRFSQPVRDAACLVLAGAILAAGTWVRWWVAAHTEFTQDEITSLRNVMSLSRWDQVFWKIDGDNNHYLNSLWLYLVGWGGSPALWRLPAVVAGGWTIVEAGLWSRSRGRFAMLASMLVFACSYMMVDYGSIARGYPELILFTLMACRLTERAMAGAPRARLWLGIAIQLGFLFNLYMAMTVIGLVAWCFWTMLAAGATAEAAIRKCVRTFLPAALILSPFALRIAYSFYCHTFLVAKRWPFDLDKVLGAYSIALEATADIPVYVHYLFNAGASAALVLAYFDRCRTDRARLYVTLVVLAPLLMVLLQVQNIAFPRLYLPCCIGLLLMIGEGLGRLWSGNRRRQWLAVGLLACLAVTEMRFVHHLLQYGRGHYAEAIAAFGNDSDPSYGVTSGPLAKVAAFYLERQGSPVRYVAPEDWCKSPPRWLLQDSLSLAHARPKPGLVYGPDACPSHFTLVDTYPFWGLTGYQWNLFRRDGG